MSLTDTQISQLAIKMNIPLADVCFKNELEDPLEYNKTYIINLDNSVDNNGNPAEGTHWTMFQVNKYPNDSIKAIYFDSYGQPPPECVKRFVKRNTKQTELPHQKKDIQSLMNNACGFYCLALAHFINSSKYRSGNLYDDVECFLDMFDDLNESVDFKKNEYILKHFFRSEDPSKRKEIDVIADTNNIIKDDKGNTPDLFKQSVNINFMNK